MATLDDYNSVRTAIFVKIDVEEYWNGSGYVNQALTFSDHFTDFTFGGDTYTALGKLLSISSTTSELRPSSQPIAIAISGIPNASIQEITYSRLLSSSVLVYRGFFDVATGDVLNLSGGNPTQRYLGYLNNYSLNEDWNINDKLATNTITLDVNSSIDVISQKTAGRKTNPMSMKRNYPTDVSFDRVPALARQKVNFGR